MNFANQIAITALLRLIRPARNIRSYHMFNGIDNWYEAF